MLLTILSWLNLDAQHGLFKLKMNSNVAQAMGKIMVITFDNVNLVIVDSLLHVWGVIHSSQLLFHSF
jgi:hypothetical protein